MIHAQVLEKRVEYWLIDQGSANGSYLNGRRVAQPTALKDGDRIRLADSEFVFRVEPCDAHLTEEQTFTRTVLESRHVSGWLLVADIVDSTRVIQELPAEVLAGKIGRWLRTCSEVIETGGGSVNRYLGDGFLAFWLDECASPDAVAKVIRKLHAEQSRAELPFRIILHRGEITISSEPAHGLESLLASDVHYVFRAEKVAGEIGLPTLFSSAAKAAIGGHLPLLRLPGDHSLKGFEGRHVFYTMEVQPATAAP